MKDEREIANKRQILHDFYSEVEPYSRVMDGPSFGMGYLAALRWVLED